MLTWTHSSTRSKDPVLHVSINFSITLSLSTPAISNISSDVMHPSIFSLATH
jgi:hypothetical protein